MRILSLIAAAALLLPNGARADAALDALAAAMGADKVKSIEYSGSGFTYAVGQSPKPGEPWPKFKLTAYSLAANYDTAAMTRAMHVEQFLNPPRGGGSQPLPKGGVKRVVSVAGEAAWVPQGNGAAAAGALRGEALLALWSSPHGVIKAAQAQNARVEGAGRVKTVAFESKGEWRAVAAFDENGLLQRVEARLPNAVLGDMLVVTTYGGYKRFGGIPFPTRMVTTANGHPWTELTVRTVKPNAAVAIAAPAEIARPADRVTVEKAADGVWFVAGGSHNSAAVEMADHVILIEAPQGDGRTAAVIEAVKQAIPGKPIRYVFNTHHHFDHSGGLRAAAAEGLTIVTHALNKPFFEAAYAAPWTVRPDRMARAGKSTAQFVTFDDRHSMGDGTRTIEFYRLQGGLHAEDLSIGWLPKEKILFVADAYSPRTLLSAPATDVTHATKNLWENIQRLKLDVAKVLPMHGQMTGPDQLRMAAGLK